MSVRAQIQQELADYLFMFPAEANVLGSLMKQLAEDAADVTHRSNMWGHVTTSALVVDPAAQKALLIHHNIYKRWLQPGGHFEASATPDPKVSRLWASAAREVAEEAGVDAQPHDWSGGVYVPFDIDTHVIAANPKKGEDQHLHHDLVYLAVADSSKPLQAQLDEVSGAQWVPLAQLPVIGDTRMARLYLKLREFRVAC